MRSSKGQLEAGSRKGAVAVLDPRLVGRQRLRQAVLRERLARIRVDRVGPGCRERQSQSATSAGPRSRTATSVWALSDPAARPECASQPRAWRVSPRRPGQRAVARPRGGRGTSHMLRGPAPRITDSVRRHPVVLGTVDASQPDTPRDARALRRDATTQGGCLLGRRRARRRARGRAAP